MFVTVQLGVAEHVMPVQEPEQAEESAVLVQPSVVTRGMASMRPLSAFCSVVDESVQVACAAAWRHSKHVMSTRAKPLNVKHPMDRLDRRKNWKQGKREPG